jgi:hypothetical protein
VGLFRRVKAEAKTDSRVRDLIEELGSRRKSLGVPEAVDKLLEIGGDAVRLLIENITKSSFVPVLVGRIGDARAFEPLAELCRSTGDFPV